MPTGTTEIDVGQLSLDDDELDALTDLGDAGLEPDDFFAPPPVAPAVAAQAVIEKSTSELLDSVPQDQVAQFEALAHQIVERVAWEIIPDIVERVIQERLDRES